MFKRHIAVTSILLVSIAAAAVTALLLHPHDEDYLQEILGTETESTPAGGLRQERRGVRRDIFHAHRGGMRTVLYSEEADLVLEYHEKDASEWLKHPYGFSQELLTVDEETGAPVQLLRYFEAENGVYRHKQHQIDLKGVAVARFQAPGHTIPDSIAGLPPLAHATAQAATALLSPTLHIEADDVYAVLDHAEVTIASQQATYESPLLTLSGAVHITTPKVSVQADEAVITRSEAPREYPIDSALFSGGVTVIFADGAQLTCEEVDIDLSRAIATLTPRRGERVIYQSEGLRLANTGVVIIHLSPEDSLKEPLALTADGETTVLIGSPEAGKRQQMVAYGPIHVDHVAKKITISSPVDNRGIVSRAKQVHFSDGLAEMHSDRLIIDYTPIAERLQPSLVTAFGNVCLKGHLADTGRGDIAQYALCDKLEYWPSQQRLLLASKPGRAAILDRANGIAVSAPAVEMRRNTAGDKPIIRGLGDVRFTLLDRDYQRLRERFNLDVVDGRSP